MFLDNSFLKPYEFMRLRIRFQSIPCGGAEWAGSKAISPHPAKVHAR